MAEEAEELVEQERSSREEEEEDDEMVRDIVLVFFCTLWTLWGHRYTQWSLKCGSRTQL